jgi:hypothetical protein
MRHPAIYAPTNKDQGAWGGSRPCDGAAALKRIMFAGARYDLLSGLSTAEGTSPELGERAEPDGLKISKKPEHARFGGVRVRAVQVHRQSFPGMS